MDPNSSGEQSLQSPVLAIDFKQLNELKGMLDKPLYTENRDVADNLNYKVLGPDQGQPMVSLGQTERLEDIVSFAEDAASYNIQPQVNNFYSRVTLESDDKGQSRKKKHSFNKKIDDNFISRENKLTVDLKQGRIEKAFVPPPKFKFGHNFPSKSEEARFLKRYDPILKLHHILLTDKDRAKTYTHQILSQFFSESEIASFSDLGVLNFQNTVRNLHTMGHPEMGVRDFILSTILANRVNLLDLHQNHQ